MKLVAYRLNEDAARLGVIVETLIVDVARFGKRTNVPFPDAMLDLIDQGPVALEVLAQLLEDVDRRLLVGTSIPFANASLLAPIPRPRKNIFGIGLNYTEHVAEAARALDTSEDLPQQPVIFSKPPTAVIADGDPIMHNKAITQQLDWEAELAVVIGTRAHRASKEDALSHVFGYTVINDISARDCRRSGQWIVSKGQHTFAPMGPCIVTTDEIEDPQDLRITCFVNGVEKQNSTTEFMLFNVKDLIEDLSQGIILEPGDIIATGTPAGVGAGRQPQEFMWPGDVVETTVEGIGTLRNPIVAA